ncbi:hypothetical protein SAMN06265379_107104 [Saccharicrinis carchari]|uniref:Tetratricopeptide repeat-containing protein n=1 Tax=Saccharicrinis carchari TaxID=1168039 RepID=A0A521E0U9_SACCC|nr:hypothetical protein [Saccharicrinis carchari]SMO77593.1 hypothetical protein SAMN06265379_107104 [Saccharicrinis carchari]
MRANGILILSSILLGAMFSCSPLKKIESSGTAAMNSYANKNYAQAFTQLSAVISNYKNNDLKVPYSLVFAAAHSALQIDNANAAADYYAQALNDSVSVEGIKGYLQSIKQIGNTKQANAVLSKYSDYLSDNGQSDFVVNEKFALALNTADDKSVVELYPQLKSTNEEQSMAYIDALEKTGKSKDAVLFVNNLLNENPSYLKAKEWKAMYYYNKAEDQYQSLMAEYNKDKNYTAYVYLKRDLKKVTNDFRQARMLFEDLRKTNKKEEKYIKYLKNIYLRLEMKAEAQAMDALLQ